MPIIRSIATILCLVCWALPVRAHELWIEPAEARFEAEGRITADLVNGEGFAGRRLPYLDRDIRRLTLHLGDRQAPVTGRLGDIPAISAAPLGEGLHVVAYESAPTSLRYGDFDKFAAFAEHKDLGDVAAMTRARGLPVGPLTEIYGRYSKALIAVGHGNGTDQRLGLATEFVALDPPRAGTWMRLQLFGPDGPRADAQVEWFARAGDGSVAVSRLRTDAEGIVAVRLEAGHDYMADAVLLRPPGPALSQETGAAWETLWANLLLRLP